MVAEYQNVKINVSDSQVDKIKKAIQAGVGVSIKLTHNDLQGDHVLAITRAQQNKMVKAYESGTGMIIKMSKTQLIHNTKITGGFLPALLGFLGSTVAPFLLKTALPALATGALSGLASTGVSKIMGSGDVYIKKGGRGYKLTPQGNGLYLRPYSNAKMDRVGEGYYLKTGRGVLVDGRGLILGKDNPVSNVLSNIPFLGPLLSMII